MEEHMEYKILWDNWKHFQLEVDLNNYAKEGWDLHSVTTQAWVILKRWKTID